MPIFNVYSDELEERDRASENNYVNKRIHLHPYTPAEA